MSNEITASNFYIDGEPITTFDEFRAFARTVCPQDVKEEDKIIFVDGFIAGTKFVCDALNKEFARHDIENDINN